MGWVGSSTTRDVGFPLFFLYLGEMQAKKKSSTKSKGKKTCSGESRNRTVVDKAGEAAAGDRGLVGALFQLGDCTQIRELSGLPAVFQRYS